MARTLLPGCQLRSDRQHYGATGPHRRLESMDEWLGFAAYRHALADGDHSGERNPGYALLLDLRLYR